MSHMSLNCYKLKIFQGRKISQVKSRAWRFWTWFLRIMSTMSFTTSCGCMVLGARCPRALCIDSKCKVHVVQCGCGMQCKVHIMVHRLVEHQFSKTVSKMSFTNTLLIFQGWELSEVSNALRFISKCCQKSLWRIISRCIALGARNQVLCHSA